MKRREFMKLAAGAAVFNIGCAGFGVSRARQIAEGAKIRLALIGCGAQMGLLASAVRDEKVVALCDPDSTRFERIRKVLGAAGEGARQFADYREMFEQLGGELDAVIIAAPNRHHALPALLAIRRGIHVYVEKPMAHTVAEVKLLCAEARRMGVVTQVGNYGHSSRAMQMCVNAVRSGVIGRVSEVWCYADRLNAHSAVPPPAPVPHTLNWDLWCGPAEPGQYYAGNDDYPALNNHDWHCWHAYGNGTAGNMGTHIMDAPFWALALKSPTAIAVKDLARGCEGSWDRRLTLEYTFPEVKLHWWDGVKDGVEYKREFVSEVYAICRKREYQNLPPAITEFERTQQLKYPLDINGALFIGEKGAIWQNFHSMLRFFPAALGKEIKKQKAGFKTPDHVHEFLVAIRERRAANTGFEYSGPLAETVLLANAVARAGRGTYEWNGQRFTNASANQFLTTTYRKGWDL